GASGSVIASKCIRVCPARGVIVAGTLICSELLVSENFKGPGAWAAASLSSHRDLSPADTGLGLQEREEPPRSAAEGGTSSAGVRFLVKEVPDAVVELVTAN